MLLGAASASAGIFCGAFFGGGFTIAGTFLDEPGFGSLDPELFLALAAEVAEPASLTCVSGNGATNVFAAVLSSLAAVGFTSLFPSAE